MKKSLLLLLIFFCNIPFLYASAQNTTFENPEADLQRARIGLVDEFIKRFNGKEIHPDIESSVSDSLNRNLLWLFDQNIFTKGSQQNQDSIRKEAVNFIKSINNDSIKLNYADTTWAAIAHCSGLVFGKQEKFDIFLTIQDRGDDMYKWVINAVDGKCFDISPKNANDNLIISPDAHETKFIALNRITNEQPRNIQLYLSKNVEYDPMSVFEFLVYSGKLKIEYVERLEFIFLQVPGYAFHIQYFDRQSHNSGWLISNFYPFSDLDKIAFREMINQKDLKDNISYEMIETKNSPIKTYDSLAATTMTDTIPVNNTLINRVNERLKLLKEYISFMSSDSNDKSAKKFYENKLINLFSHEAKVIVKDSLTGETKIMDIKKFANCIISHRYNDIFLDAITSVVMKKIDSDESNATVLSTGIIPVSVIESKEIPDTIYDKILPYHIEDTEDGVEYIFDFGNLYITAK